MRVNRRLVMRASIAVVAVVGIIVIILLIRARTANREYTDNKDKIGIDSDSEYDNDEESIVIMEVIDFEDGVETDKIEALYYLNMDEMILYRNGETLNLETSLVGEEYESLKFEPEKPLDKNKFTYKDIEEYKSNIEYTYNINIEETEEYVAWLIHFRGYKLLRRVNTVRYCEAYLLDADNSIIRLIVTADRMIKAPLKQDIKLKIITEYF